MPARHLLIALALAAAPIAPGQPADAQVSFTGSGPAGLKIEGSSTSLSLRAEGDDLIFAVPLASFHTGIDVRDRHMREDLEAEKFPTAELRVPRAAAVDGTVKGTLTLHGATRPISIDAHVTKSDVSANLKFNVHDYGITIRSYLGITVKPDIDVAVQFHLTGP